MFKFHVSEELKRNLSRSNPYRYPFAYGYLSTTIRSGIYNLDQLKIIAAELENYLGFSE